MKAGDSLRPVDLRLGTSAWLAASDGHMTSRERWSLVPGMVGALFEGLRLWRGAYRSGRRAPALALFEPPATPMVNAARSYLEERSVPAMRHHCHRTAFWSLLVLHQRLELAPEQIETTWVAALLHDVGLEAPPPRGDFSMGGILALEELAHQHRWPDAQVHAAREAIATNLSAQVDPAQSGSIAWAMNVGGLAELGFGPHRAQMDRRRIAELEARFPRDGFRQVSARLIADEAARIPDGRFAFFRYVFPFIMKR